MYRIFSDIKNTLFTKIQLNNKVCSVHERNLVLNSIMGVLPLTSIL